MRLPAPTPTTELQTGTGPTVPLTPEQEFMSERQGESLVTGLHSMLGTNHPALGGEGSRVKRVDGRSCDPSFLGIGGTPRLTQLPTPQALLPNGQAI